MKILITTDCYTPTVNGVVTSIINLETQLRRLGHEVKILCPSQDIRCCDNGDVYRIGSVGAGKIYNGARAAFRIQRRHLQKIIDWRPDVIHSQSEFTSFLMAKKIAAEVECPIVHTYHTVYENYTHYFSPSITIGRKAVMKLTRRILENVQTVIAPSRKVEALLKGYGVTQDIRVIPTGLDLEKFSADIPAAHISQLKEELKIPADCKTLITVGRAAREKNIDELIGYFHRLALPDTVFLIVGGGPYLDELKGLCADLEISHRVIFTGMVSPEKIAAYYRLGDVFVSASSSETQGLTYIEAMASGLPLVCRSDDCLNGVVINGENGYQYGGFEEFSQRLSSVFHNRKLYEQMSRNAAQTAKGYSNEQFAEKALQVYREAVERYGEKRSAASRYESCG